MGNHALYFVIWYCNVVDIAYIITCFPSVKFSTFVFLCHPLPFLPSIFTNKVTFFYCITSVDMPHTISLFQFGLYEWFSKRFQLSMPQCLFAFVHSILILNPFVNNQTSIWIFPIISLLILLSEFSPSFHYSYFYRNFPHHFIIHNSSFIYTQKNRTCPAFHLTDSW